MGLATFRCLKSGTIWSIVLIALLLVSCSRTEDNSSATNSAIDNHLRLDIPQPIASLDPTREQSGSTYVFHFLYDLLFSMNERGELVPEIGKSFDYDPVKYTWTINLNEGPRFHNGKAVQASDVIYSLHQIYKTLRPEYYASVERIVPLTEKSIRIILNKDDPKFLQKIACTEIVPEPASVSEDYYNHPIGSGPYIFESRQGEREVDLVANKDYYKGKPPLDRVTVHFEPNNEISWARLINGRTDAVFGMDPVDRDMLAIHPEMFRILENRSPFYHILLYNTHHPLFQSPNIRKALSLAIDKEAIIKEVLKGYGRVVAGPIRPNSQFHDPDLKPVPYDPQEAFRLLIQEGWSYGNDGKYLYKDGMPFEFTILYREKDPTVKGVADCLQLNLSDIGIKAHLMPLPADEFQRRYVRNTEFQAVLTEINYGFESLENLRNLWSPIGSEKSLAGCFEHPDLTRILSEAATETQPEKLKELYRKAEALIVSLQPGTFLFQRTTLDVISKRIVFPHTFSFWYWDLHQLRSASVRELKTSDE